MLPYQSCIPCVHWGLPWSYRNIDLKKKKSDSFDRKEFRESSGEEILKIGLFSRLREELDQRNEGIRYKAYLGKSQAGEKEMGRGKAMAGEEAGHSD